MNELVKLVSQRTGLSEDKARMAVDTVLNFVKGKLPPTVAPMLDNFISQGAPVPQTGQGEQPGQSHPPSGSSNDPNDLGKEMGDLFGGKKQ